MPPNIVAYSLDKSRIRFAAGAPFRGRRRLYKVFRLDISASDTKIAPSFSGCHPMAIQSVGNTLRLIVVSCVTAKVDAVLVGTTEGAQAGSLLI